MDAVAAAFWGAEFGAAALVLAGAVAALRRSLRRVALIAAVSALAPTVFALAYLGWVPLGPSQGRALAHVTVICAVVLGLMVLAMLGLMRERRRAWRIRAAMSGVGLAVLAIGWLLDGPHAFAVAVVFAFTLGGSALVLCVRRARRGDRLAGAALVGVCAIVTSMAALVWTVLHGNAPWTVHAFSATMGVVYMANMAFVLWARYSYLIELREVVAHGTAYDPITRMRTHAETGQMVGLAFFDHKYQQEPVGVAVVSIGNLLALGQLHGRAAVHHALFITAGRLRRCVPRGVEAGRLGDDAFLLLFQLDSQRRRITQLARFIVGRLVQPVSLSTSADPSDLEWRQTPWVAQVGIGIVVADPHERPSEAIERARAMSRAAWSYPSRVACLDASGAVAEASRPAAV